MFKSGRFGNYRPQGIVANGQWADDDQEMASAGNAAWDLCASNRLNGAGLSRSCDDISSMGRDWEIGGCSMVKIIELPLSEVAFGSSGLIRVNALVSRDIDTQYVQVIATVAGRSAIKTLSASAGVKELASLDVMVDGHHGTSFKHDDVLTVWLLSFNPSGDPNTFVTFYSLSAFEPQWLSPLSFVGTWKDTTAADNIIGVADEPLSSACRALLRNQQSMIHWGRTAKTNILSQCFCSGYFYDRGSYSTEYDGYGRWVVRKPVGGTSIKLVCPCYSETGSATVRASLWSIATIDYDGETSNFTAGDVLVNATRYGNARILKVTDAGTTGTLDISYITGSFENNDAIKGWDPDTGSSRGSAYVNGSIGDGSEIDVDTSTTVSSGVEYVYLDLDVLDDDCEYEIRLDAKSESSPSDETSIWWVSAFVEPAASELVHISRSSYHEQDDPIRANPYKYIKDTQNETWNNRKSIIMSDFRTLKYANLKTESRAIAYYGDEFFDVAWGSAGNLVGGLLYKGSRSKSLKCRAWLSRLSLDDKRRVEITNYSGTPVPGERLTGATSGAVAIYCWDSYDSSAIYISRLTGDFSLGETVNGSSFSCDTTSLPEPYSGQIKLRLSVFYSTTDIVASTEIDISNIKPGSTKMIEIKVDLPDTIYDNNSSVIDAYPVVWYLTTWNDNDEAEYDKVRLEQYQVFQVPMSTLAAEIYEDQI